MATKEKYDGRSLLTKLTKRVENESLSSNVAKELRTPKFKSQVLSKKVYNRKRLNNDGIKKKKNFTDKRLTMRV